MTLAETLHLHTATVPARDELADLVQRAVDGDREAFDKVMIETQKRVMSVAWRMLGDEADARDAAQETFLRVYKYLGRFDVTKDFNAWLYGITINACRDLASKRKYHEPIEYEDEIYTNGSDAEQASLQSQQREMIARALRGLPEKERAAVVLRDIEGMSTDEVAKVLKSTPTTVRSQISTARRKIKLYCDRHAGRYQTGGTR